MELSEDLFAWLVALRVLSAQNCVSKPMGRRVLDQGTTNAMEQGVLFRDLFKKTLQSRRLDDIPDLDSIAETSTPSGKLANWSIVFLACAALGLRVEDERRMLILAGDRTSIAELLLMIRQTLTQTPSLRAKRPKVAQDGALFIESINVKRPLYDADTCLEFLLLSFCQHFSVTPKQAAGLLTQGNKYLAQILGKGLKTDFQPVRNWYRDLQSSVPSLTQLILREASSGSLALVLSALRPGFLSREESVVLECAALFKALVPQLTLNSELCWGWFTAQPGGIDACYAAIQRFGVTVTAAISEVLHEAARFKYKDLLTLQLRAQSTSVSEYLQVLSELIPCLVSLPNGFDRIVEEGLIQELTEISLREADSDGKRTTSVRLSALTFLASLWKSVPRFFDEQEDLVNSILALFKKGCRDKSIVLCYCSAGHLFDLLARLFSERSTYAPLIFKSLTFLLIESFSTPLKEFLLTNFVITLDEIQSLPVATLIEPLVKQLNLTTAPGLNSVDFDFFVAVARHPRLALEHAIMLSDVCGKQYLGQLHLSKAAGVPLVLLAKRFLSSEVMQEFLYRFHKVGISVLSQAEKEKKTLPKKMPQYNNRPVLLGSPISQDELIEEASNVQRQRLVVDFLIKVVKLECGSLNVRIKDLAVTALLDLRRTRFDYHKGLMKVLALFGNPNELVGARETTIEVAVRPERRSPARLLQLAEPVFRSPPNPLALMKAIPQVPIKTDSDKRKQAMDRQKLVMKSVWEKKLESNRTGEPPALSHPLLDRQLDIVRVKDMDYADEDLEGLKVALKMYSRLLKQLFRTYCGSSYAKGAMDLDTFEHKGIKKAFIREAEIYKLLKENGVTTAQIQKEQFSSLLKSYCVKNHTQESTAVDYSEFLDVFVQVALFIYSHPPNDLSYLPPAASVLSLLDVLRCYWRAKGKPLVLFDAPHLVRGDRDVLTQLNQQLQRSPDLPLPEGFKRATVREIELRYDMPEETGLRESYRLSMWTLDELIYDSFGMHILEPRLISRTVTRVEAAGFQPTNANLNTGETRTAMLPALHRNPILKVEVMRLQKVYQKSDLMEVARLIDDMFTSVESGVDILMRRGNSGKIQNRALYLKEMKEKQTLQEHERTEQRRRHRMEEVQELLAKANEAKRKKSRKERHKKKKEDRARTEVEIQLQERRKKEADMKAKMLAEWITKKQSEEEEKRKAETERLAEMETAKKMQKQQFIKVTQVRLQQIIKQKTEVRKQEQVRLEEEAKYAEERKEIDRRKAAEHIDVERQRREAERRMKQDFAELSSSPDIQAALEDYRKAWETLYENYAKVGARDPRASNLLQWTGLNKFCLQFCVLPEIVSAEELTVLYRMYTKDKVCEPGTIIGMTSGEFADCIIRIAALGQNKLRNRPGETLEFALSDCNGTTIRSLFQYMELPHDSKRVLDLLKEINSQLPMHPRDRKRLVQGKIHIERLANLERGQAKE